MTDFIDAEMADFLDKTRFITIDLEIRSDEPLDELYAFLYKRYDCCSRYPPCKHCPDWFTIISFTSYADCNLCIENHCKWLNSMPPDAKSQWRKAKQRCMNIGYNTSSKHHAFIQYIRPDLISQLAKLEMGLAFTLYPIEIELEESKNLAISNKA